jgi:hypothetical protein
MSVTKITCKFPPWCNIQSAFFPYDIIYFLDRPVCNALKIEQEGQGRARQRFRQRKLIIPNDIIMLVILLIPLDL